MQSNPSLSGAIEKEFKKLELDKGDLMTRAEQYAGWTLPNLFTPNVSPGQEQQGDFQSLGAQGVNHLANKLVFALFNPTRPFFKLEADPDYKAQLEEDGITDAQLQVVFSKAERMSMTNLLRRRIRVNVVMAMKHLIITGNCLVYVPPNGGDVQVYSLRDYVCRRDLSGKAVLLITKDHKKKATLPTEVQAQLPTYDAEDNVVLYTRVEYRDNRYYMTQAVNDVPLDSTGEWDELSIPWIPLTWSMPRGWQYGTGLVEEYAGSFNVVSILSESLVRAGAISADIKFLVDPSGITDFQALNKAENGEYVPGRTDDVQALQLGKDRDLQWVQSLLEVVERRIAQAFLLNSAVTRDAERVTAEEIRRQAQELETSLGGVYSALADDLQTPLAYLTLKASDFEVDGKKIKPLIVTGMDSLQRDSDADNMLLFLGDLAQLASVPEPLLARIKPEALTQLLAANRGIDYENFLKSEKEVQQEQAQQQQALAQQQAQPQQAQPQQVPR